MSRAKWKKWMVLTMVAGLLCGQPGTVPVWAEELPEAGAVTEATIEISEESAAEPGTEGGASGEEASGEETVELEAGLGNDEGEMTAEAMKLSDTEIGAETAYPDREEDIELLVGAASGSANKLTWREEGDTLIITGEGSGRRPTSGTLQDVKNVRFENCKITGSMNGFFFGADNLTNIDVSGLDTSQVTDMEGMFYGCSGLTSLDLSGLDTSQVTNMRNMFVNCSGLTSLNLSGFDTSQVTDMEWMFHGCSGLTSLDVSSFDTSQVTDMRSMFWECSGLTSLNLSGFDTSQVTDMSCMFFYCSGLTRLDVSGFDTTQVTDMSSMFSGCSGLTCLDVSSFDTSQVIDMEGMFSGCSSLTSLDVSGFDTSQVKGMGDMFRDCKGLTSLDVSGFDTLQVKGMGGMFQDCKGLTSLDVSGFDTSQVTDMAWMFGNCSGLTSLDLSGFDTSQVTNMGDMFYGCSGLTSLDLSSFDTSGLDFAREEISGWVMVGMFDLCYELRTIRTPKTMGEKSAVLPATFTDVNGRETSQLTAEFCNTTLTKKEGSGIMPTPDPVPTPTPAPIVDDHTKAQVSSFVSRMYTVALNRNAEEAGLNDWTSRLLTHEVDGAGIAHGFIMSNEFQNRNLSDGDFVDVLYRTFFDREADEGGRSTWQSELASGRTRGYVLLGFVNSVEFDNLCDSFGIARGTMREDGSPCNPGIRGFVERCYTKVLGRDGEKAGVEDWTNRIASGQMSAEDVAKSFFFSDEYTGKNTDNETFVETLYQTFMGRASDVAGKADWVGRLNGGTGRQEVLEGFSRSVEFAQILAGYGL